MSVARTFNVKSVAFDSTTWSSSAGGPINFSYGISASPVPSRTGQDLFPQRVSLQDANCIVTCTLGEAKITKALGTSGTLVVVIRYNEGGSDTTLTFAGMMLHDVRGSQNRASPSDSVLTFVHVSSDGSSSPLS